MDKLIGKIVARDTLKASISSEAVLTAGLSTAGVLSGAISIFSYQYPEYGEEYNVIPKINSQMLNTRNRLMTQDVSVESIPYQEVTNPSGGKTATIGGY